ncbi:VTT domain-containing protein [Alteromonadaceae bacterium BrNp21-10]|nr:VTT domain-containing protein [Alteromonadaceae bacterium BrNp21-10]
MKSLIKVTLIIALVFASTFILAKVFGVLSVEQFQQWLQQAQQTSNSVLVAVVVVLLFADLFIAVPTLTLCILSGYFLGLTIGGMAAFTGMTLAGGGGYWLSRRYGNRILKRLLPNESQRQELVVSFQRHGIIMILLSRAMPILPEVSACLAGMTKMPFSRFLMAWSAVSIPYVIIAAYSGSISTLDNLKPALFAAIGLGVVFVSGWTLFKRKLQRRASRAS